MASSLVWYDDVEVLSARAGRLATAACPGFHGAVALDVEAFRAAGVTRVVCLLEDGDLDAWGVPQLFDRYRDAGFALHRAPIRDFDVPSLEDMDALVRDLESALGAGETVLVHCAAGLGRTGTVVACLLARLGVSPDAAIRCVRHHRPGSVQNLVQERFVHAFAAGQAAP